MKKHLHLLVILIVAVFALAACGTPAYDSDHHAGDETHEETDAAAMDDATHAEDMTEDAAHAEDAAGDTDEGEAAEAGVEESADHAHDMPAEAEDAAPVGDAAAGEELFNTLYSEVGFACATCHHANSEAMLIGPGLLNVSIHGPQHAGLGQSAVEYIYESIVEPGAYVVEGYPENLMPSTYSELLTEEQINDIVAYVMTLHD